VTVIALQNFSGFNELADDHVLADNVAARAVNVNVASRVLEPFKAPQEVAGTSLVPLVRSIYEVIDSSGTSYWLGWAEDVTLAYVPEGEAQTRNVVFASDSFEPRWLRVDDLVTDTAPYPNTFYVLGVHAPPTAPSVSASGGFAANETRVYVYTFVDAQGHESAPSPASAEVTAPSDATWTVTVPDVAPPNSGSITNASYSGDTVTLTLNSVVGLRVGEQLDVALTGIYGTYRLTGVDSSTNTVTFTSSSAPSATTGSWSRVAPHYTTGLKKRLYRSTASGYSLVTNADGTAYEVSAGTTTMTDDTTKSLGEPLPEYDRLMPPADLEQIIALPNGMLAGFHGSEVCFSEPYAFYAWPAEYRYGLDYEVRGLGVVSNTVIAATEGAPYAFVGSAPESMTQSALGSSYPCVNGRTVTAVDTGVLYASNVGLVFATPSAVRLLTRDLIDAENWSTRANNSLQAVYINGRYYMSYTDSDGSFRVLMVDLAHLDLGLVDLSVTDLDCIGTDVASSNLFLAKANVVHEWGESTGDVLQYDWKSKRFLIPAPTWLSAFRVSGKFAYDENTLAAIEAKRQQLALDNANYISSADDTGSLNGATLNQVALNGSNVKNVDVFYGASPSLTVEVYAGGELRYSFTATSERVYRLPYLGRYDDFQIRLLGTPTIYRALLASNPTELRRV